MTDEPLGDAHSARLALFSLTGELLATSESARAWLSEARVASIAAQLSALTEKSKAPQSILVDGVSLRLQETDQDGEPRWAVLIDRSPPALSLLSPRLQQVAEFAAAGATATQIAQTLGLSHHTVRGYLKEVYRTLGVSSRVELAQRVELPKSK